jgi:hypothetical protein
MPQPVIDAPDVQPPSPPPPPPVPDIPDIPQIPSGIALPSGEILPLAGLPQNAEQLQGLRERRDILRDQLERAVNRRENLVNELNGQGEQQLAPEARAGVQQRLNLIDERILQIERDQATTERLLSSADPEVLAQAYSQQRNLNDMIPEDDAAGIALSTFAGGIVLAMLVGRFRRRRSRKPATAQTVVSLADDPRIEALTQTVEAIAEEVDRFGEGQRFVTQLLAEGHNARPVLAAEAAQHGDHRTLDAPSVR